MKHVDVSLQKWECLYAMEEADFRSTNGERRNKRHGSTSTVGLSRRDADLAGALGELAFGKWAGLEPRFFEEDAQHEPDFPLIEVRATFRVDGNLAVWESDIGKAPLMVLARIREVSEDGAIIRLEGWADSEQAWNYSKPAPFPPHPKRGQVHYFAASSLFPMATLLKQKQLMEAW
jgi:hypothetical protein